MEIPAHYVSSELERVDFQIPGSRDILEFGVDWCPHCQMAEPAIKAGLADCHPVRYLKIEDGPGRRLGRSFRVKLWPTLIFLRDGQEVARLVRPVEPDEVRRAAREAALDF